MTHAAAYAPDQHGARQSQDGVLGLHRSECLLFTSLISTYLIYKGKSVVGPYRTRSSTFPFTSVSTFDLLMSSLMMVPRSRRCSAATLSGEDLAVFHALLGLVFWAAGDRFHRVRPQGPTDDTTCSLHLLRADRDARRALAVGVLWLLTLWVRALQGKLGPANAMTVEITGLYGAFRGCGVDRNLTVVYLIQ